MRQDDAHSAPRLLASASRHSRSEAAGGLLEESDPVSTHHVADEAVREAEMLDHGLDPLLRPARCERESSQARASKGQGADALEAVQANAECRASRSPTKVRAVVRPRPPEIALKHLAEGDDPQGGAGDVRLEWALCPITGKGSRGRRQDPVDERLGVHVDGHVPGDDGHRAQAGAEVGRRRGVRHLGRVESRPPVAPEPACGQDGLSVEDHRVVILAPNQRAEVTAGR